MPASLSSVIPYSGDGIDPGLDVVVVVVGATVVVVGLAVVLEAPVVDVARELVDEP